MRSYYGIELSTHTSFSELENKQILKEGMLKAINGETTSIELMLPTNYATPLWYQITIVPWRKNSSYIEGALLQLSKIEKRKQTEQQLEKAKNNLKAMFDSSPQLYAMITPDGELITTNRKMWFYYKRITGHELKEGTNIYQINNAIFNDSFRSIFEKSKKGEKIRKETVINASNNKKYWFEVFFIPVYDSDKNLFAVSCSATDITYRKISDEKIRKSEQELRELNKAKDTFVSILAHDLKSPFASLTGLTELLLTKPGELKANELKEIYSLIYQTSQQSLNLLENLLMWSREQSGGITFNPKEIYIDKIVKTTIDYLTTIASQKNINCTTEIEADLFVFADPDMVSTILRNLISNAIKFTGENGKIVVSAIKNKEFAVISVKDNGIGIPQDRISLLFDSNHYSTQGTMNEKGTGIGLMLCRDFVEKNNGTLHVVSEVGKGTSISFTLPTAGKKST